MTLGLLIKIAMVAVFVAIIFASQQNKRRAILKDLEQMRTADWQGWIEIADADHSPLFQGKIIATTAARDHMGALLFGVLLEENAPAALVTAIKARPFKYQTQDRILVRALTVHNKKLITTRLKDLDLIDGLCAAMGKEMKPETCLVLNSIDILHINSPQGLVQFEEIWETSLSERAGEIQTMAEP